MILNDKQIKKLVEEKDMIRPFVDRVEDSILVRTKKLKDQVKKNEIIKTIVQCLEDLN